MTLTFPRTNDSHPNARNYRIDSQTPENASHFAMRITLFSSLEQQQQQWVCRQYVVKNQSTKWPIITIFVVRSIYDDHGTPPLCDPSLTISVII